MVVLRLTAHLSATLAIALLTFFGALTVYGAADPLEDWRTIDTEHFRVHFDDRNRVLAERVAVLAEEVHEQITPVFGDTLTSPTDIVVIDDVDVANGSAGSVPYNLIQVYAMAPGADSTLGDSDDWLRGLLIHEYIHILHMNTSSGIADVINTVFGRTYSPNQALPRWFIEGLATYGESAMTEGGRLRNNAYRMYLRMDALSGRFRGTENLGGPPSDWPQGTAWYLYGSDFVDYVQRRYGHENWLAFTTEIGGALSPLAVNHYAEVVFGVDMVTLWGEYSAAAIGEFQAEAVTIAARGETIPTRLTESGHLNANPRCIGPNEIGYLRADGEQQSAIVSLRPGDGAETKLTDVYGNGSFDWSADGSQVVYTQNAPYRRLYGYNDLFLLDTRLGGRSERLTVGERAREPAFSPDGRRVAYVAVRDDGGVDLKELDLATGERRVLFSSDHFDLASMPDYSPNGDAVVFSLWRIDWGRDIFLYRFDTGQAEELTHDRAQDLDPTFDPSGESVLFASDRTGVFNVYELDLESNELVQLSNVVGGVFAPRRCSPNGPVVVRTYGAEGFDLGYVIEQPSPAPAAYERPEVDYPERELSEVVIADDRYAPYRTLYPRSWSPVVSQDGDSVLVGAEVAGMDAAGHHSYIVDANYGFDSERFGFGLNYGYSQLPFNIGGFLSYNQSADTDSLFVESDFKSFEQRSLSFGASVRLNFFDEESGHTFRLGYLFKNVRAIDMPEIEHDPSDLEPRFPVFGRYDDVSFTWDWSNVRGFSHSATAETGTSLSLDLRLRSPILGADFDAFETSWRVRQYFENPWLDGHVLALQYTGGIGRGSSGRRPYFAVGGLPEPDFLLSIIEDTPTGSTFLRGYERFSQVGTQFHLLNVEYRLRLWEPNIGPWTLPFFLRRLYLAAFADYGSAMEELRSFDEFLLGVGGELRLQSTIGYSVPADFRLGYAYGVNKGGEHQVYVLYGGTF